MNISDRWSLTLVEDWSKLFSGHFSLFRFVAWEVVNHMHAGKAWLHVAFMGVGFIIVWVYDMSAATAQADAFEDIDVDDLFELARRKRRERYPDD